MSINYKDNLIYRDKNHNENLDSLKLMMILYIRKSNDFK